MNAITLRVLDGSDRGRVYEGIAPPVTIGREEGNTIQLNDERVSRFHIKIQEDNDNLVLTDLESTNGTKVNGEEIQLRILRIGDMISVGRSVLLLGSREDIAKRVSKLQPNSHLSRGDSGLDLSGKVEDYLSGPKYKYLSSMIRSSSAIVFVFEELQAYPVPLISNFEKHEEKSYFQKQVDALKQKEIKQEDTKNKSFKM